MCSTCVYYVYIIREVNKRFVSDYDVQEQTIFYLIFANDFQFINHLHSQQLVGTTDTIFPLEQELATRHHVHPSETTFTKH